MLREGRLRRFNDRTICEEREAFRNTLVNEVARNAIVTVRNGWDEGSRRLQESFVQSDDRLEKRQKFLQWRGSPVIGLAFACQTFAPARGNLNLRRLWTWQNTQIYLNLRCKSENNLGMMNSNFSPSNLVGTSLNTPETNPSNTIWPFTESSSMGIPVVSPAHSAKRRRALAFGQSTVSWNPPRFALSQWRW